MGRGWEGVEGGGGGGGGGGGAALLTLYSSSTRFFSHSYKCMMFFTWRWRTASACAILDLSAFSCTSSSAMSCGCVPATARQTGASEGNKGNGQGKRRGGTFQALSTRRSMERVDELWREEWMGVSLKWARGSHSPQTRLHTRAHSNMDQGGLGVGGLGLRRRHLR